MAPALSALLAGSRREALEREQAARPPRLHRVCVRGLGTHGPPVVAACTACQARLLDTPFPPSPPTPSCFQSSRFGSTDSIRTRNQECWPHPCPSETPETRDPQPPHPSVTEHRIPAFLENLWGPAPWARTLSLEVLEKGVSQNPSTLEGVRTQETLTYHQYMPPEPRQVSRADLQTKGSALGSPGQLLWEETDSQQPPPGMKPTPLGPSLPGVPSPSPPPHKLELQTLKLEELTVSELRQQLRLRGLPVSGTKSTLLERMRGGAPPREQPPPRRQGCPGGVSWPRRRPEAPVGASPKPDPASRSPPLPRAAETLATAAAAPGPAAAPASSPSSAPASVTLTLKEELQEAIRRAQLLPDPGIDNILKGQGEPDDTVSPMPLDFPGSFDVLSPSPDSEGLSSVFSSSLPSPTNSPSPSPMDSLDWLEALSGGPALGCGPPAPSIFSADLSDSSGTRLWDLLEDPW